MPAALFGTVLLALGVNGRWWFAVAVLFLTWPLRIVQMIRRERRRGLTAKMARVSGFLLMLGKLPQFQGLVDYYRNRLWGRASQLIEYKGAEAA
jgi:hypothetical protein